MPASSPDREAPVAHRTAPTTLEPLVHAGGVNRRGNAGGPQPCGKRLIHAVPVPSHAAVSPEREASVAHRPRLLDLFCGAGGAAMGYHLAGFDVVGVDISQQPNYPFSGIQADALTVLEYPFHYRAGWARFDAIHASPPCQAFTAYRRTGNVGEHPDLIAKTRELLEQTGLPYVIENVAGAPLHNPTLICGSMFDPAMDIRRHRLFETNWPLKPPMWPCRHKLQAAKRFPGGRSKEQGGSNRHPARMTVEVGTWDTPLDVQQEAMGIDWMTLEELSEAIPPAYTEWIGHQLLAHIKTKAHA